MNNFELIDNYLTNRLSESEQKAFEERLVSDPDLKTELETQKQILEGIKKARTAELKKMLNQIPVEATTTTHFFNPMRIAAGLAGATIIAAALYLYLDKESEINLNALSSSVSDSTSKSDSEKLNSIQKDSNQVKTESPIIPNREIDKKSTPGEKQSTNSTTVVRPSIDVLDPSAEASEDVAKINPAQSTQQETTKASKIEVLVDASNSRYNFHYKFYQGKLQLYGSFNSDLYEIIDINTDHHALFLFYKDAYYFLDESNSEVTPLEVIKDEALLKKLKEYRAN